MSSNSLRFVLLNALDPAMTFGPEDCLISTSLTVSYELTRRNIPYSILEDYYSEVDLRAREEAYFYDQLAWLDRFDTWLQGKIEFAGRHELRLLRASYQHVKYLVDSIVIQAFMLDSLMAKAAGAKADLLFVTEPNNPARTMQEFRKRERDLLFESLLAPLAAKHGHVSWSIRRVASVKKSAGGFKASSGVPLPESVKNLLRAPIDMMRYPKWNARKSERPMRIFFPHSGSRHLDPVISELMASGVEIFTVRHNSIQRLNSLFPKPIVSLTPEHHDTETKRIEGDARAAARDLRGEGKSFIDWVSTQAGVDVEPVLLPYLESFVRDECPRLLAFARHLHRFFESEKIECVMSHTNSDRLAKSAVLAAGLRPKKVTAGIQHGCHVFNDLTWPVHDQDSFDLYFTTDSVSEELHAGELEFPFVSPTRLYQSPHFLKSTQALYRDRPVRKNTARKTVLYIPTVLSGHVRFFNNLVYPVLWFFEFQKKLVDFFGTQTEFDFVYKDAVTISGWEKETIIPYLSEKAFPNVRVSLVSVIDALKTADAVVMDRPSTAFFEVAACGLPLFCLYPDWIQNFINQDAASKFGRSLAAFYDETDALAQIDRFLKDDWTLYRPILPIKDVEISRILMRELERA